MSLPYVFVQLVSLIYKNIYWHSKYLRVSQTTGLLWKSHYLSIC